MGDPCVFLLREEAIARFAKHHDKDCTLCDCASFALMRERIQVPIGFT
jgi:predicted nucleic acid-binding protein